MSSPISLLLIEPDRNVLLYLSHMLQQAGFAVISAPSGKEGLIEAWRQRPAIIVLDTDLPDLSGLELTRKLRGDHRTAATRILLLAARANPEDILAGMQAGADEYIVKRAGADAELLSRLQSAPQPPAAEVQAAEPPPAGRLISFLSAKGGTGTSSLCANMAQIIASQVAPRTVAVVDLVLPIGSISQIVGLETPLSIVEATQLSAQQLLPATLRDHAAFVPGWGFYLVAGSPDPEAAQALQVNHLEAVFTTLRRTFDFVLVDFGRALSRISLPVIRASTRVVLVLSADRATVALSKTTLKYLELQGVRRNFIYPIINRAVGLEGMTKAETEQELALSIPGLMPYMSGTMSLANNLHVAIASKFPNDSSTFALHALATGLLTQVETEQPPPGAERG